MRNVPSREPESDTSLWYQMDTWWTSSSSLLLLLLIYPATMSGKEYCHDEGFQATCKNREVVLMKSAIYGRMGLGRCVKVDFGFVGCQSDVLGDMDRMCSGRHDCHIPTIASGFTVDNPCLELTRYLEAEFICVPVVSVNLELCRQASYTTIRASSGYLSNLITRETSCGTATSPWVIEVDPLQKIIFTLYDFNVKNASVLSRDPNACLEYASIEEPGNKNSIIICGGEVREKTVYTTKTNKIRVSLRLPASTDGPFFLLYYRAIGCPKLKSTPNTWVKHEGNHVTLGCETSPEKWKLECKNGTWHGKHGNCTNFMWDMYPGDLYDPFNEMLWNIPSGFVIAVVASISLVITVAILVVGIVCLKRQAYVDQAEEDIPAEKDGKPEGPKVGSVMYVKPRPPGYDTVPEGDQSVKEKPPKQHSKDNIYRISQPLGTPEEDDRGRPTRSPSDMSEHVYDKCGGASLYRLKPGEDLLM